MAKIKFGNVAWREDKQRWRARYNHNGKRYEASFPTEAAARAWLRDEATRLLNHAWTSPEDRHRRFADVADAWWQTRGVEPATAARDRSMLTNHVLPFFGTLDLEHVDYASLRRFVAALNRAGYSPHFIQKAHQLVRQVLHFAYKQRWLPMMPPPADNLPKVRRVPLDILAIDEVWAIADAIDRRYRALVLFAAYTGARTGEVLGLRIDNLDLLHRVAHIVEDLENVGGRIRVGAPLKTVHSQRSIALPAVLVTALEAHLDEFGVGVDGLVFHGPTGAPVHINNWRRRHWRPAVEAATGRYVTPYRLRHTAASIGLERGAAVTDLAAQLGNSPRVVLDTYAQQVMARQRVLADLMDEATGDLARDGR